MSEIVTKTKGRKRKLIGNIITGVLFGLVGMMAVFQVYGQLTAKDNLVNYGNFSTFIVKTNSMEPTYEVNTMIFVNKTDLSKLKASSSPYARDGDTITFVRNTGKDFVAGSSLQGGDGLIITHRVISVVFNEEIGEYQIRTLGDNLNASTCGSQGCTDFNADWVREDDVIGKVIGQSRAFGEINIFLQNPLALLILVMVPLAAIFGSSVVDLFKQLKEGQTETSAEEREVNINPEFEAIKEQEKLKLMIELEKEKMRNEMMKEDQKDEEKQD